MEYFVYQNTDQLYHEKQFNSLLWMSVCTALYNANQLSVTNSTFEGNEILPNLLFIPGSPYLSLGGAIYAQKGNQAKNTSTQTIKVSGNTFLHNFANFGGSIFIGGNLKCTLYSSQNNHTKNTGLISGGAVFSYCQTITISGDVYERNIASSAGAAMAITVKSFTSINSSYIENINKPNPKVRSFMSSYIENITSTHHANGGPVNIDLGDNGLCNISQNRFI